MDNTNIPNHQISVKKMRVSEVKPGMVLARDVVTSQGFVLLAKDTIINPAILDRLVGKGISSVYIKEANIEINHAGDIDPQKILGEILGQPQKEKPVQASVKERKDFGNFTDEYDEKLDSAEELLRSISNGTPVNADELFKITNATFSKLKAKSDVLTYMSFLREQNEHIVSHSYNVSLLCNLFAQWVKMDAVNTKNLTVAGLLHDVGKFKVPSEILYKKGKLTEEEFKAVKNHAQLGYDILRNQNIPGDVKLGALMHHERFNGSGYPDRVKGDRINNFARIIAICDTYDAMTASRSHRAKICPFDVIKKFEVSGYDEFDTSLLLTFLRNIAYIYFGSWVKLSDGVEGEIVYIHQNNLSRPVIRSGDKLIDLQRAPEISIVEVL